MKTFASVGLQTGNNNLLSEILLEGSITQKLKVCWTIFLLYKAWQWLLYHLFTRAPHLLVEKVGYRRGGSKSVNVIHPVDASQPSRPRVQEVLY